MLGLQNEVTNSAKKIEVFLFFRTSKKSSKNDISISQIIISQEHVKYLS